MISRINLVKYSTNFKLTILNLVHEQSKEVFVTFSYVQMSMENL